MSDLSPREVRDRTLAAVDHLESGLRDLDRAWSRLQEAGWLQDGVELHRLADEVGEILMRTRRGVRSVNSGM